jgi:hypothetical protein
VGDSEASGHRSRTALALRGDGLSWRHFLRGQAKRIFTTDFFYVDTQPLQRQLYVLLVVEQATVAFASSESPPNPSAPGWPSRHATL